jgi:hypothetical protein
VFRHLTRLLHTLICCELWIGCFKKRMPSDRSARFSMRCSATQRANPVPTATMARQEEGRCNVRKHSPNSTIDTTPALPIMPALELRPDAVYLPRQVIAALGLRASSLRSEWRAGRLRIVRRCGHNFLLGRDILAWLDGSELLSPAARKREE